MPKILVVADEAWVVNDVHAALAEASYQVTVLDDPADLADTYRDVEPDVVILDLQVGSMGGMAGTREIRHVAARDGTDPAPVIVLLDREADGFLAKRAGATARLRKPFNGFDLRDLIDTLTAGEPVAATAE
ncbi:MAG TPA: response regulator [Acidimicrobiia bacterium]|nr:response regulator [Acidimicrobiia bacterium]